MNVFCVGEKAIYRIYFSFNPCPPTLLKSALKRAHDLLHNLADVLKTPSPDTINAIISSAGGDLRCAVNQYYFAALKGKVFTQ